jgi:hypothetical protein
MAVAAPSEEAAAAAQDQLHGDDGRFREPEQSRPRDDEQRGTDAEQHGGPLEVEADLLELVGEVVSV